ncbi:hypothetical protein Taro_033131 [Colocasia esculenta]|uniref:Chlororespiratory reduction 4 n=1 Tax=Colocasia esculenta TaxID=4460 RepID=A0A843W3W2_COLES|nr:hypothetical protein [Colocasia esculenta]
MVFESSDSLPSVKTMAASASSHPAILSFAAMASSLDELRQAHAHMLKTGLFHSSFAAGRLVSSAVALGGNDHPVALAYAHSLFAHVGSRNSFVWNTMIRAHASSGDPEAALLLFLRMLHSPVLPDKFTFPFVLKACSSLLALEEARQVHARVLKSGLGSDLFVMNTLLHVLASARCTMEARKLFERMPNRDVISRNALISSYVEQGLLAVARNLFDMMTERKVETWNFLISGYVKNGLLDDAIELFIDMPIKDVVSWNAIITGFNHMGRFDDVLALFRDMQCSDVRPDSCTLVTVLCACAQVGALALGEWVHAYIHRNGIKVEGFLATALVDLYSKSGCIGQALQVFNSTLKKDISTWNSMIYGLGSHGRGEHAVLLFQEMLALGFAPNMTTFISVLSACNHTGLLDEGRRIFDQMVKSHKIEPTIEHYGCLVDLLGRAGFLKEAEELINELHLKDASVLWESLLGASTRHGNVTLSKSAAKQLVDLHPRDSSSYVQLSNAFASMGRWDDARQVRDMMSLRNVRKEPGCSTIELDGIVHEFFAG